MHVTALYAGLLAPLFLVLSMRVIRTRHGAKVGIGDGGDKVLQRAMRVHANFAEYVPFALLLMALAESLGTWNWLLHLMGAALAAGRLTHAYGVSQSKENLRFRVGGMAATLTVIGAAASACVFGALSFGT
jgi:uncharacterized protein